MTNLNGVRVVLPGTLREAVVAAPPSFMALVTDRLYDT